MEIATPRKDRIPVSNVRWRWMRSNLLRAYPARIGRDHFPSFLVFSSNCPTCVLGGLLTVGTLLGFIVFSSIKLSGGLRLRKSPSLRSLDSLPWLGFRGLFGSFYEACKVLHPSS